MNRTSRNNSSKLFLQFPKLFSEAQDNTPGSHGRLMYAVAQRNSSDLLIDLIVFIVNCRIILGKNDELIRLSMSHKIAAKKEPWPKTAVQVCEDIPNGA